MSRQRTYLDHNATSPLRPQARDAMIAALGLVGNPSSVHAEGRRARAIIEDAREKVAALVGALPQEVVFTSGATEANNWALGAGWDCIHLAAIEHDSVLAPAHASGARIETLPMMPNGEVDIAALTEAAARADGTPGRDLVTLQWANSETGVIQDIAITALSCKAHGIVFHCDAVQAAGRIPIEFDGLGIDLMSVSSHKIGGPMGVGALIVRDGLELEPLMRGGGQERRQRAGTENLAAIAGFGAAAVAASAELRPDGPTHKIALLAGLLHEAIQEQCPGVVIIGNEAPRLFNTFCIAVPDTRSQSLLIKLDLAGIAVSAGSACSSGKVGASHVLAAMGIEQELAQAAIRVSLGWSSTRTDVDRFVAAWTGILAQSGGRQRLMRRVGE